MTEKWMMFRVWTNSRVRKRMKALDKFFADHAEYFGYGIYVGRR